MMTSLLMKGGYAVMMMSLLMTGGYAVMMMSLLMTGGYAVMMMSYSQGQRWLAKPTEREEHSCVRMMSQLTPSPSQTSAVRGGKREKR